MDFALATLRKSIARWTEQGELHTTPVPGLSLFRRTEPSEPVTGVYEPGIGFVAQGSKHVQLGDESYVYVAQHYLITWVHLPTVVQMKDASLDKPLPGASLEIF